MIQTAQGQFVPYGQRSTVCSPDAAFTRNLAKPNSSPFGQPTAVQNAGAFCRTAALLIEP
ncbi:MAG: hypothetical protein VW879_11610 [Opitutae bacterium]